MEWLGVWNCNSWWEFRPRKKIFSPPPRPQIARKHPPGPSPAPSWEPPPLLGFSIKKPIPCLPPASDCPFPSPRPEKIKNIQNVDPEFFGLGNFKFQSLKFGKNRSFCGISGIFLEISASEKNIFRTLHAPPFHTPTKCQPIIQQVRTMSFSENVHTVFASQAAWYRMENGPKSNNGKKLAKKKKMTLGPKWGENRPKQAKNGIWGHFSIFLPFLGHFFPISGRGSFSIFWPIFSHFWISARFPFYTRRPDSQHCLKWLVICDPRFESQIVIAVKSRDLEHLSEPPKRGQKTGAARKSSKSVENIFDTF